MKADIFHGGGSGGGGGGGGLTPFLVTNPPENTYNKTENKTKNR